MATACSISDAIARTRKRGGETVGSRLLSVFYLSAHVDLVAGNLAFNGAAVCHGVATTDVLCVSGGLHYNDPAGTHRKPDNCHRQGQPARAMRGRFAQCKTPEQLETANWNCTSDEAVTIDDRKNGGLALAWKCSVD